MYCTYVVTLGVSPHIALVQVADDQSSTILAAMSLPYAGLNYDAILLELNKLSSRYGTPERNLALINTDSEIQLEKTTESVKTLPELQERSIYRGISLGAHTRYFSYGTQQTVYSATVPEGEVSSNIQPFEQAGWHVHYYSALTALLPPMLFRGLDGFVELTNKARLTIFTATSFKQYTPPVQLYDTIELGAQTLGLNNPAQLLELYTEIGEVRAPRYLEQLTAANVDAEEYYSFVNILEESLAPLTAIVDRAISQKPKLQLATIGALSNCLLTQTNRTTLSQAATKCQCPAKIQFGADVDRAPFSDRLADLLIAVNGCITNTVNFSTAIPVAVMNKQSEQPKIKEPRLALGARKSARKDCIPVMTLSQPEVPMESISTTQITLTGSSSTQEPTRLNMDTPVAVSRVDSTLQEGLEIRRFNLGASLFTIGLVLLIIGTIGKLGLRDSARLVPIAEQIKTLETQQITLSTQLEARSNATRLTESTFTQFVPYIEYIGQITDENVTVTDFNLIGDQSLRISGIGSNSDNFRKFKSGLESISVNMDVLLVDSAQTASDQTFTFEITCKEVPHGTE